MGRKKSKDKRLLVGCYMPPLFRTQPGCTYNFKNDEVLNWLSNRPGLLLYVFDKLVASGIIVYNSQTEKWQGIDYEPDED